MKRLFPRSFSVALATLVPMLGCSSGGTDPGPPVTDAGGETCAQTLAIAPTAPLNVLTCRTQQFTATLGCPATPTWKATAGTIDGKGLYSAPMVVPDPATATVTASVQGAPDASTTLHLSTALPQPETTPGKNFDDSIYHHVMAANGSAVYSAMVTKSAADPAEYSLMVARSDDGGATWKPAVKATHASRPTYAIEAPAIAVDAGNPDVVYVSYTIEGGSFSDTSMMPDTGGETLVLAVSTDGGKTFKDYVLDSRVSGWQQFADVTSPAPNTVVVEAPTLDEPKYLRTYVDTAKGAGFAATSPDGSYFHVTNGIHDHSPAIGGLALNAIESDGGSNGLESPRLFADGKGKLCVTYVGGFSGTGDSQLRVIVQCSPDQGATFGDVIELAKTTDGKPNLHHPIGSFGPNHEVALAYWTTDDSGSQIWLSLSKDDGKTFAAPKALSTYQLPASAGLKAFPEWPALAWEGEFLWLAYIVGDGSGPNRLIVDKSCDGGTTWSGAQLVNGPEGSITGDYDAPGLLIQNGKPAVFSRKSPAPDTNIPVSLIRLVP